MNEFTNQFIDFLNKINYNKDEKFSGLGVIVYDSRKLTSLKSISLQDKYEIPGEMNIYDDKTIEYLLEISANNHMLHDGFHFIDENGRLTHVCQFVEARIRKTALVINKGGARYATAILSSISPAVIMSAIIGNKYEPLIFKNGKLFTKL